MGLIEKKLENANRDADERVDKIQRKLDEANLQFKKKEKYVHTWAFFPTVHLAWQRQVNKCFKQICFSSRYCSCHMRK